VLDNGIVCDSTCTTSVPGIVAAGDVARWDNPRFNELMRVEHWDNAAQQGRAAAVSLLQGPEHAPHYDPVPYFWSDQYETKIQFVGRAHPDDVVSVAHGSVAERKFVALYGREGRLVGALSLSQPRRMVAYRKLILEGSSYEAALEYARAN
jgi:NADPH-dependent 2,4-dienoyl-CoA reductase/sulfur reductase-like enzyme